LRHYEDLPASVKKRKKDELEVDYQMRTAQIGRKFKDAQEAINVAGKDPYRKNTALVLTGMIGLKDGRADSKEFFNEILSEHGTVSWLYRAESWFGLACDELANGDCVQDAYKRLVAAQYVYVLLGLQGTPHTEFPLLEAKNLNDCTPANILMGNEKLRTLGKETCFDLRKEAIIYSGIRDDLIWDLTGRLLKTSDPLRTRVAEKAKYQALLLAEKPPWEAQFKEKKMGKNKVFIGHGRSFVWRDVKDFLADRLHLDYDEYNREATAGFSTKERLESMLNETSFALLVMTAEDEHTDATHHARENVVHELGLFQGRLGFRRAIVLLEEGCTEFSNITGISQIRFPKGDITAKFEEIRRVLEREGILHPSR
jgi:hypothetical protein